MYTISCSEACLDMFGMTRWNGGRGESFSYYAKWSQPCSVVGTSQQESTSLSEFSRSEASSNVNLFASCCTWKCHNIVLQMSSTLFRPFRAALFSQFFGAHTNLSPAAVYMSSDIHGIRAKHCLWQWPSWAKDSLGHPPARNSQFVGMQHIVWCDCKGKLNWDTINWNPIKFP